MCVFSFGNNYIVTFAIHQTIVYAVSIKRKRDYQNVLQVLE